MASCDLVVLKVEGVLNQHLDVSAKEDAPAGFTVEAGVPAVGTRIGWLDSSGLEGGQVGRDWGRLGRFGRRGERQDTKKKRKQGSEHLVISPRRNGTRGGRNMESETNGPRVLVARMSVFLRFGCVVAYTELTQISGYFRVSG